MTLQVEAKRTRMVRKVAVQLLFGGLLGLGAAEGGSWILKTGVLGPLGLSQGIALTVAMFYAVMGLIVGLGTSNVRLGSHVLNVADEADLRDQRVMLALSAFSMVLMGGLLAMLALAAPGGIIAPNVALAIFAVSVAVLIWLTFRILKVMDELMKAVSRECGEVAYYLVLAVAGGWAVLAHLGFVPGMAMLDFVTLNYVLLLAASFIATGRRGLMKLN